MCIQLTGSWTGREGQEHTHNSLKEAHSPNFHRPPEAHRKSTNNANNTALDDIPPHPHHNHITHFLRGWSKSTSTQSTTLKASPPARLCPQLHLDRRASARSLEGRDTRSKVTPREGAHSLARGPRAMHSPKKPGLT